VVFLCAGAEWTGDLFSRGSLDFDERGSLVGTNLSKPESLQASSIACGMGFVTENNSADKLCVSDKKKVV
jgi:hypothetical protein